MPRLPDLTAIGSSNPKIQRLRRLTGRRSARLDEGRFVIEGATLIAEAVAAGIGFDSVYVESGFEVPDGVNAKVFDVVEGVIASVASTVTPQPMMAIAQIPERAIPADATFIVVADHVNDPGNAGTILRSAEAAGADAAVFTPGSVDIWSPKVVRSSAGAIFHLPVVEAELASVRLPLVGAVVRGGIEHDLFDFRPPFALVVGNEAHGISDESALAHRVTIGHVGRAESLNVAMATTVLCFEVSRQRRARNN